MTPSRAGVEAGEAEGPLAQDPEIGAKSGTFQLRKFL
jgi:hypothetical protein